MSKRPLIWVLMFMGGIIGGYIPSLWGASFFSFTSILFNAMGAIAGIYIGFRLAE